MTTTPEKNTRLSDRLKLENKIDSLREEFDFLEEHNLDWDDWLGFAIAHQLSHQNRELVDGEANLVDICAAVSQYTQALGMELELESGGVIHEVWVAALINTIKAISTKVNGDMNQEVLMKWLTTSVGSLAPKTTKGFK